MKCGHCGSEVEDGYHVCPNCGANYRRNLRLGQFALAAFLFLCGGIGLDGQISHIPATVIFWGLAGLVLWRASRKRWWRHNA